MCQGSSKQKTKAKIKTETVLTTQHICTYIHINTIHYNYHYTRKFNRMNFTILFPVVGKFSFIVKN